MGGLIGTSDNSLVAYCVAEGSVFGMDDVGGMIGDNYNSEFLDCYSVGSVFGNTHVGGFVGLNGGVISRGYCTGSVAGYRYVGGFAGRTASGNVYDSFWDVERSGKQDSRGGTGKNTLELQSIDTFLEAGWDFVAADNDYYGTPGRRGVWRMCVDGVDYPRLSWKFGRYGDFTCPDGVGMEDVAYLAERWLDTGSYWAGAADANGDERIDLRDFAILTDNWPAD